MDFLKKHYEKIVLGVVLLGLFGAVIALPIIKSSEEQAIRDILTQQVTRKVQPLPDLNLSAQEATLKRIEAPGLLDFGPPHKLFNPLLWERMADGHLIKADSSHIGPNALQVVKLVPLYLIITNESVSVSDSGTRYIFGMVKEASPKHSEQQMVRYPLGVGGKNSTFEVRAVEGPPNDPTNLVVHLLDTDTDVKVSKDKAFKRVDGYMADLKYPPESHAWTSQRVGATLIFNGEDYKIVSISEGEVVVSAPNQKKWTVKYIPGNSSNPTNTPSP
jgi:hypothetical protein